jgi:hypothetical protein
MTQNLKKAHVFLNHFRAPKLNCVPFLSAALVFAAASKVQLAQGSEVRVRALSAPAGIDDEAKVFLYPSLVTKYSLALAEFGTAADQEAYAMAIAKVSTFSLGAAISRDASLYSYFNPSSNWSDDNDFLSYNFANFSLNRRFASSMAAQPRRPVDLMFGMGLEGDKSFGLRLTLAGDTREVKGDSGKSTGNSEQVDVRAGLSMPASTGRMDLSLGLGVMGKQEVKVSPANGDANIERYERGLSVNASGRWVSTSAEKAKPFVKAGLTWANPKTKAKGTNTKTKTGSELFLDAQAGYQYIPTEAVLLTGHGGAFYMKSEGNYALSSALAAPAQPPVAGQPEPQAAALDLSGAQSGSYRVSAVDSDEKAKVTGYGLAIGGGAEGLVTESVGLLVGMNYLVWGRVETKDGNSKDKSQYTTNLPETPDSGLWSLGMFYKRQSFRADGIMTLKRFVHNGPYFVTGTATAPIVAQFAASYVF